MSDDLFDNVAAFRWSRSSFLRTLGRAFPMMGVLSGCKGIEDKPNPSEKSDDSSKASLGWHMPAEWHSHARCWMAWPGRKDRWDDMLRSLQKEIVQIAHAIARFEPVTILANRDQVQKAQAACGLEITVLEMQVDDMWTRDTAPTFLIDGKGGVAGAGWLFNAWGKKHKEYAADADLKKSLLSHLNMPCVESKLVTEGGSFLSDGEGTILTTETSILNKNRNPGLSKADAEKAICSLLGAKKVIWLPGSQADKVTDGHIDGIAAFARPGVTVAEVTTDRDDPEYHELQENLRALRLATDAKGRQFEVVVVQRPTELRHRPGDDFCRSYVNFYLANKAVVMPKFNDRRGADDAARDILARVFPDRTMMQVALRTLPEGGGGIHCVTQNQPTG